MSRSKKQTVPLGRGQVDTLRGIDSTPSAPTPGPKDSTSTTAQPDQSGGLHPASTGFTAGPREKGVDWAKWGTIGTWVTIGLVLIGALVSIVGYVLNIRHGVDKNSEAIEQVQTTTNTIQDSVTKLGSDISDLKADYGMDKKQVNRIENDIKDMLDLQSNPNKKPINEKSP